MTDTRTATDRQGRDAHADVHPERDGIYTETQSRETEPDPEPEGDGAPVFTRPAGSESGPTFSAPCTGHTRLFTRVWLV